MRYLKLALIGFVALLIILLIFLCIQYEALRRAKIISAHELLHAQALERHAPLAVSDAGVVRSWMTFDYINKIFNLPPDYLLDTLVIKNSQYPRIAITEYAESQGLDEATFLNQVQDAIRSYSGGQGTSTSTSSSTLLSAPIKNT